MSLAAKTASKIWPDKLGNSKKMELLLIILHKYPNLFEVVLIIYCNIVDLETKCSNIF